MSMINLKSLVLKDGKRKRNTKTKKEGERDRVNMCACVNTGELKIQHQN